MFYTDFTSWLSDGCRYEDFFKQGRLFGIVKEVKQHSPDSREFEVLVPCSVVLSYVLPLPYRLTSPVSKVTVKLYFTHFHFFRHDDRQQSKRRELSRISKSD
jgi:hypothetical protein